MDSDLTPDDALDRALAQLPLVAILRGLPPGDARSVGQALWDAGWRLMEVPLNSPQPLRSIATLAGGFPEALVGAGTVLSPRQVHEVHQAGGRLIVCPHLDAAVVAEALNLGLVCLPGVATPSEAFTALRWGASGLKLFPAEMMGPTVVRALRAVLPAQARLLPVGGLDVGSLAAYRQAGASGLGIGSAVYRPGQRADQVLAQARGLAQAWSTMPA